MGLPVSLFLVGAKQMAKRRGIDYVSTIMTLLPKWLIPLCLSEFGAEIGANVTICRHLKVENAQGNFGNLCIGDRCYIGLETLFDLTGTITIENDVALAPRCTVLTHQDVGNRPLSKYIHATKEHTVLRKGCWIGAGAILLGGVEIGENAIVAAGSVVNKNVEAFSVYAGVPAKLVRRLE